MKKKYITYKNLKFGPHLNDPKGIHAKAFFPNGYGISVIKTNFSYGTEKGLFEVGVIKGTPEAWALCYTTPITDDVIGYCTPRKISSIIKKIQMLGAK